MAQPKSRKATKSRKAKKATTTTTELSAEQQAGMALYMHELHATEAQWHAEEASVQEAYIEEAAEAIAHEAQLKASNTSAPTPRRNPLASYTKEGELVNAYCAQTVAEYLACMEFVAASLPKSKAIRLKKAIARVPSELLVEPVFAYNHASFELGGYSTSHASNSGNPFWATNGRFSATNAVAGYARTLFNGASPATHAFCTVEEGKIEPTMQTPPKRMVNPKVASQRAWLCGARAVLAELPSMRFLHMATWEPAMLEAMQAARSA